jgi:hypothetical protein
MRTVVKRNNCTVHCTPYSRCLAENELLPRQSDRIDFRYLEQPQSAAVGSIKRLVGRSFPADEIPVEQAAHSLPPIPPTLISRAREKRRRAVVEQVRFAELKTISPAHGPGGPPGQR